MVAQLFHHPMIGMPVGDEDADGLWLGQGCCSLSRAAKKAENAMAGNLAWSQSSIDRERARANLTGASRF
jgi:hypothetical protein